MKMEVLRTARRACRRATFGAAILIGTLGCRPEAETPSTDGAEPRSAAAAEANARASRTATDAPQPRPLERALDQQLAAAVPDAATPEIDPEAAGAVAPCAVCHGPNGEGNAALDAPRIGGLDAYYLARQLQHFRSSVRAATDADKHGSQMRAMAISLKDDEVIADLATYFSTLQPPLAGQTTVTGDATRGAQLYMVCVACHGMDGRGSVELNTPSVVGQYDWYLVRQLNNFRNRLRGAHPSDVYGMQMAPIVQATLMSDQDVEDVVAYIGTLQLASGERPPAEGPTPERGRGSNDQPNRDRQVAAADR